MLISSENNSLISRFIYFYLNLRLFLNDKLKTHEMFIKKRLPRDWYSLLKVIVMDKNWNGNRIKLHKIIIKEIFKKCKESEKKIIKVIDKNKAPVLIILKGGSGSGKSTFIEKSFNLNNSYLSPDIIRTKLKNKFLSGRKDSQYDLESFVVTKKITNDLFSNKVSFIIERRFDFWDDLEELLKLAKNNSYKKVIIFDFDIPVELSLLFLLIRNKKGRNPFISYQSIIDGYYRIKKGRYEDFFKTIKYDLNLSYSYIYYDKQKKTIKEIKLVESNKLLVSLSNIKILMNSSDDVLPQVFNIFMFEKFKDIIMMPEEDINSFKKYNGISFKDLLNGSS